MHMKALSLLIPAGCLLLLSGCAILERDYKLSAIGAFPRAEQKPSVCVEAVQSTLFAHGQETSAAGDLTGVPVSTTPNAICEALENSGLFSSALRVNAGADYAVSFKSRTDIPERSVGRTLLFVATLGLFPICDHRTYQLTAVLRNNRTGAKKLVQVEETADFWCDTVLFPVGIFKKPADTSVGIQKDLNENMAIALHAAIADLPETVRSDVVAPQMVAPVLSVVQAPAVIRPLSAAERPAAAVRRPLAPPPAAPPSSTGAVWPALVIKGTFVSGGKTLVLLGDGLTLEAGTTAPNGIQLLEASPSQVSVCFRGETRTYRRNGAAFFVSTNGAATALSP